MLTLSLLSTCGFSFLVFRSLELLLSSFDQLISCGPLESSGPQSSMFNVHRYSIVEKLESFDMRQKKHTFLYLYCLFGDTEPYTMFLVVWIQFVLNSLFQSEMPICTQFFIQCTNRQWVFHLHVVIGWYIVLFIRLVSAKSEARRDWICIWHVTLAMKRKSSSSHTISLLLWLNMPDALRTFAKYLSFT